MTKPSLITLLTDFGEHDVYVGVMKGVIAAIEPQISVIDLTHQIPPQNLIAGRFALLNAYAYFPLRTVHVAVIDPGVGSQRRGVAIEFAEGFLVGADNGLFSGVLEQSPAIAAVELNNSRYWRVENPSTTFHGRDIFAAVGAHLATGVDLKDLGTPIKLDSLVQLPIPQPTVEQKKITGCIQYIDIFGNLITNIAAHQLFSNPRVVIKQQSLDLKTTYSDGNQQELVALVGSHGYVEIAVNCGNAQQILEVAVGEKVIVSNVSSEWEGS